MIRTMLAAAAAMSLLVGTAAGAAACRDPKTHKFVKCPPPVAKTTANAAKHCRNAKGHFVKCGTPGAHAA
jgi:hypothetical protein